MTSLTTLDKMLAALEAAELRPDRDELIDEISKVELVAVFVDDDEDESLPPKIEPKRSERSRLDLAESSFDDFPVISRVSSLVSNLDSLLIADTITDTKSDDMIGVNFILRI